jgi:hypothetical protein
MKARRALLLSGGIGDFLHYLSRIPSFLDQSGISPSDLLICIESTAPERVESIFRLAFPEFFFCFTPGFLHWTRTNPLLIPHSELERIYRPAYQYLRQLGYSEIEDWFLPFLCSSYEVNLEPIFRIVAHRNFIGICQVVISARDKGFLWWPSAEAFAMVQRVLPKEVQQLVLGTPDERTEWTGRLETPDRLEDALAASFSAELFIGTDTGLATVRELVGKKNIYCINQFWLQHMMVRYHYLGWSKSERTTSIFATNLGELRKAVVGHFRV